MKINIVSDLHLECEPQTLPGGEVLILAGDIAEYRTLKQDPTFLDELSKYDRVFYVMGNHEHYHHRLHKTYNDIKALLPANTSILENEIAEYNGVLFLGATLWTDLNQGDPVTMFSIRNFMNDYKTIQNFYPKKNLYHKLTPEATLELHKQSVDYFRTVLAANPDRPVVVITHHAPSFASVNEKYLHDTTINGGYASELSELILEYPNIKLWVHGHMHDPVDYHIGSTRVVSNPRGYVPWESGNGFDANFTVEVTQ